MVLWLSCPLVIPLFDLLADVFQVEARMLLSEQMI